MLFVSRGLIVLFKLRVSYYSGKITNITERFYTVGYMPQGTKPNPRPQLTIKGRCLEQFGFLCGVPCYHSDWTGQVSDRDWFAALRRYKRTLFILIGYFHDLFNNDLNSKFWLINYLISINPYLFYPNCKIFPRIIAIAIWCPIMYFTIWK